jgi:hypothetical protein
MEEAIGEYLAASMSGSAANGESAVSSRGGSGRGTRGPQLIGMGTSVLVRLWVRDDPDQDGAPAVFGRARRSDPRVRHRACSSHLDTLRRYRRDKTALIATVERLLSPVELDVGGRSGVMGALRAAAPTLRITLRTTLRITVSLHSIAKQAPTDTFDEQATSSPAFALVS